MDKNEVLLFAANVKELNNEKLAEYLDELSPYRREKAERIKNEKGKLLSVGAGLLLKKALESIGEDIDSLKIEYRENEKPYVKDREDLYFNLSHSEDMVLCVISGCEAGCDIECIKDDRLKIARKYFTEEEKKFVMKKPGNFFRMWTLKESFMKVTGKGLLLSMKDYSIHVCEEENDSCLNECTGALIRLENSKEGPAAQCTGIQRGKEHESGTKTQETADNEKACTGQDAYRQSNITVSQKVDGREYYFKEYFEIPGYAACVCSAGAFGFAPKIKIIDFYED